MAESLTLFVIAEFRRSTTFLPRERERDALLIKIMIQLKCAYMCKAKRQERSLLHVDQVKRTDAAWYSVNMRMHAFNRTLASQYRDSDLI